MLKSKLQVKMDGFKPFPFTLKKDRRKGGFEVTSAPIDWEALDSQSQNVQWAKCLNALWFYENEGVIEKKDLAPFFWHYVTEVFSEETSTQLQMLPEWRLSFPLMSSTFLLVCGAQNEGSIEYVGQQIEYLAKLAMTQEGQEVVRTPPLVRTKKLSSIVAMIEEMEDGINSPSMLREFLEKMNPTNDILDEIRVYYGRRMIEFNDLFQGTDEQLNEAYRSWKKEDIESQIEWYAGLFDILDEFSEKPRSPTTPTTRKVRAKKPIDPKKVISKLKYLREYEGIRSIDPTKILGSSVLVAYDTVKRKLCVYMGSNMSIKGTTLIGWDANTSSCKTLRKPEIQLQSFVGVNKGATNVAYNSLKSKPQGVNGRINRNMVLLRAF